MIAVAAAAGLLAPSAHATQNLQLDARGPDVSSSPLQAGAVYYARVAGTASIWARSQWELEGSGCGAAEVAPMYPSSGTTNGPVGFDAETIFGVPPGVPFRDFRCVPAEMPFHVLKQTPGGFQIGIDGNFAHTEPIGGPYSVPRADHTYLYRITGAGTPVSFRFDDGPVTDNYGVFRISVLTEAECQAENCTGAASNPSTPGNPGGPVPVPPTAPGSTPVRNAVGVVVQASTARRCSNRRIVRLRLKAPTGVSLRSAVIRFGNKTLRVRGRKLRSHIDLRGVPRKTFKARITMTTTRGQTLQATRTFKACAKKKR